MSNSNVLNNAWFKLAAVSVAGIVIIFGVLWGVNQFSRTTYGYNGMNMNYGNQTNGVQMQMQNGSNSYGMNTSGNMNMQGNMNVQGNTNMQGNTTMQGNMNVQGTTNMQGGMGMGMGMMQGGMGMMQSGMDMMQGGMDMMGGMGMH